MVTHNVRYLPLMDNIIVLQNGVISECGTYTELLQKGGDFAKFLSSYVKNDGESSYVKFYLFLISRLNKPDVVAPARLIYRYSCRK